MLVACDDLSTLPCSQADLNDSFVDSLQMLTLLHDADVKCKSSMHGNQTSTSSAVVCVRQRHVWEGHFVILLRMLLCRHDANFQPIVPAFPVVEHNENMQPNSYQVLAPDTEDAKSERIRQLHLTLGALIDERDELQDTLSKSARSELAQQLEEAQVELHVLRKYADSHTSGRTSLAELDLQSYR